MGEFAALEVKVEAIEIPPPVMVVMVVRVVVMRWRMAGGRAWYFGFISSFMSGTRGTTRGRKVMGGWRTRHVELQPLTRYRRIRV